MLDQQRPSASFGKCLSLLLTASLALTTSTSHASDRASIAIAERLAAELSEEAKLLHGLLLDETVDELVARSADAMQRLSDLSSKLSRCTNLASGSSHGEQEQRHAALYCAKSILEEGMLLDQALAEIIEVSVRFQRGLVRQGDLKPASSSDTKPGEVNKTLRLTNESRLKLLDSLRELQVAAEMGRAIVSKWTEFTEIFENKGASLVLKDARTRVEQVLKLLQEHERNRQLVAVVSSLNQQVDTLARRGLPFSAMAAREQAQPLCERLGHSNHVSQFCDDMDSSILIMGDLGPSAESILLETIEYESAQAIQQCDFDRPSDLCIELSAFAQLTLQDITSASIDARTTIEERWLVLTKTQEGVSNE